MTTLQPADTRGVLDPDHPLARVITQLSIAEGRCLVVSGALVVGACAMLGDVGLGAPLTAPQRSSSPACSSGSAR